MAAPDVWAAKEDGSHIVRAAAIAGVGRDYNGNVSVRLSGGEQAVVTLVSDDSHGGSHTPDDFHRLLLRRIAELSDTSEPAMLRPAHDEQDGWKWQTKSL